MANGDGLDLLAEVVLVGAMTDLIAKLRAALERELQRTDWPHRPGCQMLQAPLVPSPFARHSCNCDGADLWMRLHEGMRKILDEHDLVRKMGSTVNGQELLYYCGGCGGRDWDLESVGTKPCPTVRALAEAYGIEVET